MHPVTLYATLQQECSCYNTRMQMNGTVTPSLLTYLKRSARMRSNELGHPLTLPQYSYQIWLSLYAGIVFPVLYLLQRSVSCSLSSHTEHGVVSLLA